MKPKYKIVREIGRNERGITETFWEVYRKRFIGWRFVCRFCDPHVARGRVIRALGGEVTGEKHFVRSSIGNPASKEKSRQSKAQRNG